MSIQRKAIIGTGYLPPEVTAGITEARNEIHKIKSFLRSRGASVEDLLNEETSDYKYVDIGEISKIEKLIETKKGRLINLKQKRDQANDSIKPDINEEIQNLVREIKQLNTRLAVLLTYKLQNNSIKLFQLTDNGKYSKTTEVVDGPDGIYATLRKLRSIVNMLIGKENTNSYWKDRGNSSDGGSEFMSFIFGAIVAAIFTTWAISASHSQGQDILKLIQKYSFETEIPKILRIADNATKPTLGDFGFEGKHSLALNLSPLSSDESNRRTMELVLTDTIRIEAISATIFIPENKTAQPTYAQLEAVLENDVTIHSIPTQLRPGFWTPMFWGTRSTFGDITNIKILRLLIHCPDTPYNGLVYIDDLNIYDLVPEKPVNPTVTPSPANKI